MKRYALFFTSVLIILASCRKVITTETWLGIYLNGQKIGFQHVTLKRHNDGFLITDEELLKVSMYGQEKRLSTYSTIKVGSGFDINAFQFELRTRDQTMTVEGNYWNDTLYLQVSDGNFVKKKAIPISGPKLIMPGTFMAMLMTQQVKPGKYLIFDPSTFTLDTATVNYVGQRDAEVNGKRVKCKLYSLSYIGTETIYWVYDNGKIARVEMPMHMTAKEESAKEAKSIGAPMDILSFYSIRVNREIPSDAHEVKLHLDGINPKLFDLDFGPQYLTASGDTWAEVRVTLTGRKTELADSVPYLSSDEFIQSDAEAIKEKAAEITSGIEDDSERAYAIMDWVYNYLEKRPSVTVPSALDVLKQGYGDCNEHSVLFAALARAAGIPTEVVVGLIYQGGAYYYHAWDAVYVDGQWIFVDPIFYEFPASARHLMLKRGGIDKQSEIVSIIGNLKIEVMEVK